MSFDALIQKVKQAESALEAQERAAAADWRQLRVSWHELWTPGRIVVAGLASGFMVGRTRPLKMATGGGALQLLTALSGMFAAGGAQAAADEAGDAAAEARDAGEAVAQAAPAPPAAPAPAPHHSAEDTQRRYREAGLP